MPASVKTPASETARVLSALLATTPEPVLVDVVLDGDVHTVTVLAVEGEMLTVALDGQMFATEEHVHVSQLDSVGGASA